jgi:hypothetical protein
MRTPILASIIAAALSAPASAGDLPPLPYGVAPSYAAPSATYPAPPAYGYVPPRVYRHPPGVIAAPEGPAYIVPGPAYQAGSEYETMPIGVDARRYYRECQWEWGFRRCHLWSKYFFW